MDNAFSVDQVNPFEGITPEAEPVQTLPDATAQRTAAMAGLINSSEPDVLTSYKQGTSSALDLIKASGDADIRSSVAAQQRMSALHSMVELYGESPTLDPTGQLQEGVRQAGANLLQDDQQKRAQYALEQETILRAQQLASNGDRDTSQLLLDNLDKGGPTDVLTDVNTKRMILQREIEKAGIDVKSQSWLADGIDFAAGFLPLYTSTGQSGNVDIDSASKNWYDSVFSGQRKENEASALWSMPTEDFTNYVRDHLIPNIQSSSTWMGYKNQSEELNLLSEMNKTTDPLTQNVYNGMDNLGLVSVLKPLKAVVSIPMMLVRNGARQEAAGLVADAVKTTMTEGSEAVLKQTGLSSADIEAQILPKAVNPQVAGLPQVSLATSVNESLTRGDQLLAGLPKLDLPNRLLPEERQAALDAYVSDIKEALGNPVKDVTPYERVLANGSRVQAVKVTVGKASGDGFASESTLNRYVSSLGISGQAIVDESGKYFLEVDHIIPESGFYTVPVQPNVSGSVGAYLRSGRNVSDSVLADMAQMSGDSENKIFKSVVGPKLQKFHDLSNDERSALGEVLSAGENDQKWFNTDELDSIYQRAFKRSPSTKEVEAYQSALDINDLEHTLRNDDLYKTKATSGLKTVSAGEVIDRENAWVNFSPDSAKGRVFNLTTNEHLRGNIDWESLRNDGYALVTHEEGKTLADGTRIKNFIVKRSELNVEDLRRDQLQYRPGGHRIYDNKHYVKQAEEFTQPDTGEKILQNPNTFVSVETRAQADLWASEMEKARQIYNDLVGAKKTLKKGLKGDVLSAISKGTALGSHAGLPSAEEFVSGLNKGWWNKTHPFEAVGDRELPSIYSQVNTDAIDFGAGTESGRTGLLRKTSRMYYGGKGDHLPDFNGRLAPTLDPYKTINQSLSNVAKLSSFSDYKISSINRWVETYKKYLRNYSSDASPVKLFSEGVLDLPPSLDKIKQQAEAQRSIIQRILGHKTEFDRQKEIYSQRLSNWVAGDDPFNARRAAASKKVEEWMSSPSPLTNMRRFASDAYLGFFNPAQFILQAASAATAVMVAGLSKGVKALYTMAPLRMYLTKGGTEELLNAYVKKGLYQGMGFSSPDEFKSFMRSAKNSGFFDFGDTHQLINAHSPNAAMSDVGNVYDRASTAGRFFWNEGETLNRAVAYRIAWDDAREALPELAFDHPDFLQKVAGRREDWAMQMSKTSTAQWQSGAMSIPTQFWAYNARITEAFFGKQFTREQKVRLLLSQMFLGGAAGTPLTYELAHQYQVRTGDPATDMDTWKGMMNRGALDSIVYHITGADAQLGERIATGNWISNTVRDLFGFSQYGEKSMMDVLGGASGSMVQNLGKTLTDTVKWSLAETGGEIDAPILRDDVVNLASNISTLGSLNKAYLIWKYGILTSKTGTLLASGLPTQAGFAQALGFAPGDGLSASAMQSWMKDQSAQVDDLAKQIVSFRQKAFAEGDRYDDYYKQINLLMRMYPDNIRQKALAKAHRGTPDAMYDSIAKRYESQKALEQLSNTGDE